MGLLQDVLAAAIVSACLCGYQAMPSCMRLLLGRQKEKTSLAYMAVLTEISRRSTQLIQMELTRGSVRREQRKKAKDCA